MYFTTMVKGATSVKIMMSVDSFKDFMENIPIVKTCKLKNNNEAVIELNNGVRLTVFLAVAEEGYPKQIRDIIGSLNRELYPVIIAPYISRQTSVLCKDAGVGYLDFSGNCFMACGCLYIDINGNKNVNISRRGLKSIYERSSAVSSAILRIMLEDVSKVWKMKELAESAGCSIGQVAKVKEFLLKQDYIEKTSCGIRIAQPEALMRDWAEVYGSYREEKRSFYSLESVPVLETKLARMKEDTGVECFLTGFSGGSRYQPVVRYQKVHAYVEPQHVEKVMEYLGLKEVDSGANVILIFAYDDCVKRGAKLQNGNMVVSPVQLYLDCMNIKGRGEEMAQAILEREICR